MNQIKIFRHDTATNSIDQEITIDVTYIEVDSDDFMTVYGTAIDGKSYYMVLHQKVIDMLNGL